MGVPGLTTFLNQYLSTKHASQVYIRDCTVIIDGNNLIYHIYLTGKSSTSHLVGGDYIEFASKVRKFFEQLKNASITSIVVLDGAQEVAKLATAYQRFNDSITEQIEKNSSQPSYAFIPIAIKFAFLEVLQQLKILHFQTILEADDTIALFAKKLSAPVLSSDSDFQIYTSVPISIPLDSLQFRKVQVKGMKGKLHAITAKVVSLKRLCKQQYKFEESNLWLLSFLAIVLGNDKIPKKVFGHMFQSRESKDRFLSMLTWLQERRRRKMCTVEEELISQLKFSALETEGGEMDLEELIKKINTSYQGGYGEEEVWKLLINPLRANNNQGGSAPLKKTRVTYKGDKIIFDSVEDNPVNGDGENADEDELVHVFNDLAITPKVDNDRLPLPATAADFEEDLPPWFISLHHNCHLPCEVFELVLNKRIWFKPQAELPSYLPSQEIAIPIILVVAGLLCGDTTIEIVTRNGAKSKQKFFSTTTKLPLFGLIPTIHDPKFKNKGKQLLLETFGCTRYEGFIEEWPSQCRFIILTLIYLIQRRLTCFPIAIGILLSILKHTFISANINKNSSATTAARSSSRFSSLINAQAWSKNLANLYKNFELTSPLKNYNILRVYHFCEFQSIFTYGKSLNLLLGLPYKMPKVLDFNSYIVYHVHEAVESKFHNNSTQFIREWFKDEPIGEALTMFLKFFEDNLLGEVDPIKEVAQTNTKLLDDFLLIDDEEGEEE